MHPDDAIKAAKIGFDAICISNHGGRAFDGGISSLEALKLFYNEYKSSIILSGIKIKK